MFKKHYIDEIKCSPHFNFTKTSQLRGGLRPTPHHGILARNILEIYLFITLSVGSLSLFNFVKMLSLDLNLKFLLAFLFCEIFFIGFLNLNNLYCPFDFNLSKITLY